MSAGAAAAADFFAHEKALVESPHVGARTRVWAFAHVLPGARIGADCNICDGVFVENDVVVGDRVTVKCGVQLWDGVTLEDDVFVGPNATFTNDLYPRSRQYPETFARTLVRAGATELILAVPASTGPAGLERLATEVATPLREVLG